MIQEYCTARDGNALAFRWLPAECTDTVLICLHGSTFNSQWYLMLGRMIHRGGITVCLPDWRGHGDSEGRPGDVDYTDQLQDDLHDLMNHLKRRGVRRFVLGGHSAGSLVCLRYLSLYGTEDIIGYFAIAPPFTQTDETRQYDMATSGLEYFIRYFRKRRYFRPLMGDKQNNLPKLNAWFYGLALLFPVFRRLPVLTFPSVGSAAGNQGRVLTCSFNLLSAYSTKKYTDLLACIDVPCHILVGEHDEVVDTRVLYTIMNWHLSPQIEACLTEMPKVTHMSAISASAKPLSRWLRRSVMDQVEASV